MPDWRERVRERLQATDAFSCREEVVEEIATHLIEVYDAARASGLPEAQAVEVTLQEVGDWHDLARKISHAKSREQSVNYRTRSFWLPTLITLSGASFSLLVIQSMGIEPHLVWIDLRHLVSPPSVLYGRINMTFYWPWLASLPFFGALGAYLSGRSHASTRSRLVTGLSPALIMLVVMCVILPIALAIDGFSLFRLAVFGVWGLMNWVAIPAIALLLGTLPWLHGSDAARA